MRIVLKKAMGELSEEVFTGSYKSLIWALCNLVCLDDYV